MRVKIADFTAAVDVSPVLGVPRGPMVEQQKLLLMHHGAHLTHADWDEPHLLGYHLGSIYTLLEFGIPAMASHEKTQIAAWAWQQLTTMPEAFFLHRSAFLQGRQDVSWKKGFNKGMLYALLLLGKARRDAPEVAEALEAGRQLSQINGYIGVAAPNEMQDAAAVVATHAWFAYVMDRRRSAA